MSLLPKTKRAVFVCSLISLFGLFATIRGWMFVGPGNHWGLFGTPLDRFIQTLDTTIALALSLPLIIPALIQRHRLTLLLALAALPLFVFFQYSLRIFAD